ncbi:hypothetical protein LZ31DRAFT_552668, partial [Colletotrichum somersetense]
MSLSQRPGTRGKGKERMMAERQWDEERAAFVCLQGAGHKTGRSESKTREIRVTCYSHIGIPTVQYR